MGKFKGGPNQKVVAANEKKAAAQAEKDAKARVQQEKAEAAEWSKGANNRKLSKMEEESAKADEAARKRREKAELLAAEEAELGGECHALRWVLGLGISPQEAIDICLMYYSSIHRQS
jgi:hypothetical protein